MAAPTTYTYSNKLKVGKGRLAFNKKDATTGLYEGFRWLGDCPGFEVAVESENLQVFSSEGGLAEVILDTPLSITRSATINVINFSADNLGIFLGASVSTLSQTSASVTNEAFAGIRSERAYQLGVSVSPSGVRGISAAAVDVNASSRANSTAYAVGALYVPATPNTHLYICTVAGTSDASLPTFTTDGTTYADGTATFKDLGVVTSLVGGTDFLVDGALGLLSIPTTGKLGAAYAAAVAAVGTGNFSLNIHVDYTRPANTREQIATGSQASVQGQLKFVADNPIGDNQDVFFPDCTLRPNGALPFITDQETASVEFAVGINKLDSVTAAIYVDGRPAA